jgi:hypothetical protein
MMYIPGTEPPYAVALRRHLRLCRARRIAFDALGVVLLTLVTTSYWWLR